MPFDITPLKNSRTLSTRTSLNINAAEYVQSMFFLQNWAKERHCPMKTILWRDIRNGRPERPKKFNAILCAPDTFSFTPQYSVPYLSTYIYLGRPRRARTGSYVGAMALTSTLCLTHEFFMSFSNDAIEKLTTSAWPARPGPRFIKKSWRVRIW